MIKAGIKKFGKKGNDAVLKELRQLHDRKAVVPIQKEDLTLEDKQKAFGYLMFIKRKKRWCHKGKVAFCPTQEMQISS